MKTIHHRDVVAHGMGIGINLEGGGYPNARPDKDVFWTKLGPVEHLQADRCRAVVARPDSIYRTRRPGTDPNAFEDVVQMAIKQLQAQVPDDYVLEVFTGSEKWWPEEGFLDPHTEEPIEMEKTFIDVFAVAYPATMKRTELSKAAFQVLLLAEQLQTGGQQSVDLSWYDENKDFEWANLPLKLVS